MENSFLTKIAQDYNAKIEAVEFNKLGKDILGRDIVGKVIPKNYNRDSYLIWIDRERTKCVNHIFFILFHEIGHVQLFHLGYKFYINDGLKEARENEADLWAFKELGMIDKANRPTADNIACYECLTTNATSCLKYKT